MAWQDVKAYMDYRERIESARAEADGDLSREVEEIHVAFLDQLHRELTEADQKIVELLLAERSR